MLPYWKTRFDMTNNTLAEDKGIESALKYNKLDFSVIARFRPGQINFKGEISNGKDPAIPKIEPYNERLAT